MDIYCLNVKFVVILLNICYIYELIYLNNIFLGLNLCVVFFVFWLYLFYNL